MRTGDRVVVAIPKEERCASRAILAYNNQTFEVSRVRRHIPSGSFMIELKGVISPFGIPYTFLEEWLQPVEV
jgi:hypothetical protein